MRWPRGSAAARRSLRCDSSSRVRPCCRPDSAHCTSGASTAIRLSSGPSWFCSRPMKTKTRSAPKALSKAPDRSKPALRFNQDEWSETGATKRIHRQIADSLGEAIVSGEHPPGSLLPDEIQASGKLRVSRTAYREAIRILAAKGLVESRPKAGTRVTRRQRWHLLDPDVLGWVFKSEPSESFLRGLFELREILEPRAAALAAERRTPEQLGRMGHALEEMARYGLATPEGRAADQSFHEEIL